MTTAPPTNSKNQHMRSAPLTLLGHNGSMVSVMEYLNLTVSPFSLPSLAVMLIVMATLVFALAFVNKVCACYIRQLNLNIVCDKYLRYESVMDKYQILRMYTDPFLNNAHNHNACDFQTMHFIVIYPMLDSFFITYPFQYTIITVLIAITNGFSMTLL